MAVSPCVYWIPRRLLYSLLLVLFFLLSSSPLYTDGEVAEVCSEEELRFACADEDEVIAIKDAWLYGSSAKVIMGEGYESRCHVPDFMVQYKKGSFLQYVNKLCGGRNECNFTVWNNVPRAKNNNESTWKGGVLRATYDCVKKSDFHQTCGSEVWAQTGWVHNVGYPDYYLGVEDELCSITIRVDDGQKIRLTLTDLSIRDMVKPTEKECRDSISITEGNKQLLSKCGEINEPHTITSEEPAINITLNAADDIYLKRGFMAHFQALGCESPGTPEDGYRSFRNETHAEYWCCVHHVFPDTLARRRLLQCNRAHTWNDTVPDCVALEDLLEGGNITETEFHTLVNGTSGTAHAEMYRQAHIVYDLVVPTVIMTVLVLGNVAIVILIIYCRRGIMEDGSRSEELESIKANPEPTDVVDTTPCSV